ncbi:MULTISPECIES: hypothetical protein [unclassified Variovorax]|uniref:hypothetical protein n=1 Tax=unclassified Variovorax TaxID=663243 RepID=UPI000B88CA45|nr:MULTISPECIES: hypothetical protein [unclassified Variovorax]
MTTHLYAALIGTAPFRFIAPGALVGALPGALPGAPSLAPRDDLNDAHTHCPPSRAPPLRAQPALHFDAARQIKTLHMQAVFDHLRERRNSKGNEP